jgi:potassium channel subfamily K
MISVIALIVHWRVKIDNNELAPMKKTLASFKFISFSFGIIGNIYLLLNFSKTIRYLVAQSISITCWIIADTFLLVVVVVQTNKSLKGDSPQFRRLEGFWFGTFYNSFLLLLFDNPYK